MVIHSIGRSPLGVAYRSTLGVLANRTTPGVCQSEFVRPDNDVLLNSWETQSGGTTNLWETINEVSASDADYITTTDTENLYRADLSAATVPITAANHVARFRWRWEGSGADRKINLAIRFERHGVPEVVNRNTNVKGPGAWHDEALSVNIRDPEEVDFSTLSMEVAMASAVPPNLAISLTVSWVALELCAFVIEQTADCTECPDGMSRCWELAVAGVIDDVCTDCDNPPTTSLNGTFILKETGPCLFQTDEADYCGAGGKRRWTFGRSSSGTWVIRADGSANDGICLYHLPASPGGDGVIAGLHCNAPQVFNFVSNDIACAGFPATLTVTPIECPDIVDNTCGVCEGGIAECWEFAAAGVSGGDDEVCAGMNGTFILKAGLPLTTAGCENGNANSCCFDDNVPSFQIPGRSDAPDFCSNKRTAYWSLSLNTGGGNWELAVGTVAPREAVYTKSSASFNCTESNVMTLSAVESEECCTGLPATITIEPIACP